MTMRAGAPALPSAANPDSRPAGPPVVYPPSVLQEPMRRVVVRLRRQGVDLGRLRALEFFAREGDWQAVSYAPEVASLDAWEINPQCEPGLRRNLPQATIRIGDSYALARLPEYAGRFDLVVMDNPQVTFGPRGEHCEHFDALDLVPVLLAPRGIVVFNVNHSPYGYDRQPEWQRRRQAYYGVEQTAHLELDFLESFYRRLFHARGYDITFLLFEPRHEPAIAYCVMELRRNSGPKSG
jgi:hypothetical protein